MTTARQTTEEKKWSSGWDSLPLMWLSLGYTLPRHTRERVFKPLFCELHEGYVEDLAAFRRKTKQRRLGPFLVFTVRLAMNLLFPLWTVKLIYTCFRSN